MTVKPFGPWLPDIAALESGAATDALNCIPRETGYGPMPGFAVAVSIVSSGGRAQGTASFRDLTGGIHNFYGDATALYKLASNGLSWTDVSRTAGGAYATPSDGWWEFFQFGNIIYATNGFDAGQTYTLGTSTDFAAAAGTPPVASFSCVIRGFGFLARVSTAWNKIVWSAIEDVTDWVSSATTLADSQSLPDGGIIMGLVGGEYGLVFQQRAIQRITFEGPPTAFRFDKITTQLGVRAERSIQVYESLVFFLSDDGFKMMRGGMEISDIGTEKIDRWFESDLDNGYIYRISSAIDPIKKLYILSYPSVGSSGGSPDSLIIYHWPTGKWSHARVDHELIYSAMTQSGYTLDGLDSISASLDALPHSLDSRIWSGSGRLLLAGFDTSHVYGFFDASNLAATMETGDGNLVTGHKSFLRAVRPIVEGTSVTPSVTIGYRNLMHEPIAYTSASVANSNGVCRFRKKARYHRARLTIPAADVWTVAQGVDDIEVTQMGTR